MQGFWTSSNISAAAKYINYNTNPWREETTINGTFFWFTLDVILVSHYKWLWLWLRVLLWLWFERSLHPAQVSWQSCHWSLKRMTSQVLVRTWIPQFKGDLPFSLQSHQSYSEKPPFSRWQKFIKKPIKAQLRVHSSLSASSLPVSTKILKTNN